MFGTLLTIAITITVIFYLQKHAVIGSRSSSQPNPSSSADYRDDIFADIIKINEESLQYGSLDTLTGLPGRQIFDVRMNSLTMHCQRFQQLFCVMIINVDGLAHLNHVYGEQVGNAILAEVTARLRSCLRQIDTISRYAGDHFYLILPELGYADGALRVAHRIQDSMTAPFVIDNHRLGVTVSTGISLYQPDMDPQIVLNHAREALANAKLIGSNSYFIYKSDSKNAYAQIRETAKNLTQVSCHEGFMLLYQPYVDTNQQQSTILQAIPYFKDQMYGMLGYRDFYHSLEISSKLVEFAVWQLNEIMNQLAEWQNTGSGLQRNLVMMKVSLRTLENKDCLNRLNEVLNRYPEMRKRIIFEIDGHFIKTHQEAVNELMHRLAASQIKLGVSLLVLGKLKLHNISDLPIEFLKIDEELVTKLQEYHNDMIIQSLLMIAGKGNIVVLAEGVDFQIQKSKLIQYGCTIMRGQLFLPAESGEELAASIKEIKNISLV